MKSIFGIFKKGWFLSLLGLIALALVIWFVGPLIAIADVALLGPVWIRALVIGLLFLLWAMYYLMAWLHGRKANQAVVEGITATEPGEEADSAAEVEVLRRDLEEALNNLKKARLGGKEGRQQLYQLPWYIIIGPPGSGKTTALVNSGLNFPLAQRFGRDKLKGVGGTRNCDWWFTDEAVLLDTAGRYTTQDSHQQVDKAGWTGFLKLLKKHRRRRPINGAIVAVSLSDLLRASADERQAHAQAIRNRIQELHEMLGIRFPVYVLFTKMDLAAGFMEFHEDLGREERKQVWGMTFPLEHSDKGESVGDFSGEFALLEQRLNDRVVQRLQDERDPQRRDMIFGFPKQFSALRDVAQGFLEDAFRPNRYEEPPMLRGVYFTSGTQEGTPIDRLIGSLANTFQLDRRHITAFSGGGRSYFITRLFQEVVFRERELAGVNLKVERRRRWIQRAAYAATLVVVVLGALAWITSYTRNQAYVQAVAEATDETENRLADLGADDRELLDTLPTLNAARGVPGGYEQQDDDVPLSMRLGLYQGEKLGIQATRTYQRLLYSVFLPRLELRLEQQMRDNLDNPDYLYEALKVYLMLDDPEHFDAQTIKEWMALDWQYNLPRETNQEQRDQLALHLDALLQRRLQPLPLPQDQELVNYARQELLRLPLAQRIYNRLKNSDLATNLDEFRLSDVAGRNVSRVFTRKSGAPFNQGIPGFYTYNGYYGVFTVESQRIIKAMADEAWVLGTQQQFDGDNREQLTADLRQLYFDDYIQHYQDLLRDLDMVPLSSLNQAVDVLDTASNPSSPIRRLLEGIAKQTSLTQLPEGAASVLATEAERRLNNAGRASSRIVSGIVQENIEQQAADNPAQYVEGRFHNLNEQIRVSGGQPPLQDSLSLLDELRLQMSALALATDRGSPMPERPRDLAIKAVDEIERNAQRKPLPLNQWLNNLAKDSDRLIRGGVRASLNAIWTADVLPFFRQSLSGRYPLARSARDATLDDFGRFFGPDGLVDSFFKTHLRPLVNTTSDPWQWRSSEAEAIGIPDEVLLQFQRADAIKAAFFRGAEPKPSVGFELKPLSMDADASLFLLDLGGQKVTYAHGPTRPTPMQWPAPGGDQVQVQFSPPLPGGRSGATLDGPWAWFRLLDRSGLRGTSQPERFRVTFSVGGRSASFELRAASTFNPFRLEELKRFQCPERL